VKAHAPVVVTLAMSALWLGACGGSGDSSSERDRPPESELLSVADERLVADADLAVAKFCLAELGATIRKHAPPTGRGIAAKDRGVKTLIRIARAHPDLKYQDVGTMRDVLDKVIGNLSNGGCDSRQAQEMRLARESLP
jgi:hypothetical protein